jgi:hypothetical protein
MLTDGRRATTGFAIHARLSNEAFSNLPLTLLRLDKCEAQISAEVDAAWNQDKQPA